MANCEFATERRSSTQRSASEAEIDDIIGVCLTFWIVAVFWATSNLLHATMTAYRGLP